MSAKNVRPIKARSFVGEMTVERFETKIRPLIDRIQTLRQKIRSSKEFKSWHRDVESLLCFSFGDDSAQTKGFRGVSYSPPMWSSTTPESFFDKCFYSGLDDAEVYLNNVLNEVLEYFPERNAPSSGELDRCAVEVSKDVFIVHGHDEQLLLEVEKAIIALDLNPVVLREQPNEGMTLIQKFEKNSSRACFAIFLLTDDESATVKRTGCVERRARQNVVFEMGYFFNAFRNADGSHKGIFAILEKGVVKPGDVDGLVYHEYQKGDCSWKLELAKELKAAGVGFLEANILKM